MKILFLSHYFPPEVNAPASRTYEHCVEWVKQGHQVTIITCAPNHPHGKVYSGYKNKLFQKETINGVTVIRVWTYVTANEGVLKRTLNYLSYMVTATLASIFVTKPDVVITTSPQFFNGVAGYFTKLIKRTPWLLEIRDLWPESIVAVGAIKNERIINLLVKLEHFIYKKCDHIVVVTDSFKKYMIRHDVPREKVTVIKNGVDLERFNTSKPSELNKYAEIPELKGKFVASYFGTHGMAHRLDTILECALILKEQSDIVFLLVGDGAERKHLLEKVEKLKLTNVVMFGQTPKRDMPLLWEISDVSLILLRDSELFHTVIPSKIFESFAMQKPIILGVQGESAELIQQSKAGVTIQPENADELAAEVMRLYENANRRIALGENGKIFVEKYFNRKDLARRYLDLLSEISSSPVSVKEKLETRSVE